MQVVMLLGFARTYPVNWWPILCGISRQAW